MEVNVGIQGIVDRKILAHLQPPAPEAPCRRVPRSAAKANAAATCLSRLRENVDLGFRAFIGFS